MGEQEGAGITKDKLVFTSDLNVQTIECSDD